MKSIHTFYYNLESSALCVQRKIWGRYFNELSGMRVINASIGMLIILWLFIATKYLDLNLYLVFGLALIPFLSWLSYHFTKAYRSKSAADKIEDFNALTPIIKWAYLIYVTFIMVVAPILILLAIAMSMFKLL
ncbi:hypothetical protein CPT03_12840 [Pedobacter ginsengisoli]|uniref:Uncharacterized protein n=1 Tax=Pedobacter ginsengisoli TaxID=363852 RepID=A0A2D1U6R4_9SPHI|nr:hypothetical protein [Pedobacter ginsengisoli]ATP57295.1 hypothetical protein CPT03_12840 [Pedobacter ginsengisoli]